jgi:carbon storage regulator
MLVLARKKGESIMIGDSIEIVVLISEGDTVKLGIRAPKQVGVYRKELYDNIRHANEEASNSTFGIDDLGELFRKVTKKRDN